MELVQRVELQEVALQQEQEAEQEAALERVPLVVAPRSPTARHKPPRLAHNLQSAPGRGRCDRWDCQ